jgi:TonB-dependent receptor
VHRFDLPLLGVERAPELDWTLAHSQATLDQPDKRQFGSLWKPGRQAGPILLPPTFSALKPTDNLNVGNVQRIFKKIEEESDEYAVNLKLPFEQWTGDQGYVKVGLFDDEVRRRFDQDTFSNAGEDPSFNAPWQQYWSATWPFQHHPIGDSLYDVDYTGQQKISATYAMMDLPIVRGLNLIGGARFEKTRIGIQNQAEEDAVWYPPGTNTITELNPGDADVDFRQNDVLPAIAVAWSPADPVTFRASYTETVARQTFKELTPILQQEYLGAPIFIGNPELGMSELHNIDFRADCTPYEGSFLSASWFHKDVIDPIEYVQRITTFDYTTAVNYPRGKIDGWEIEARQALGKLWDPLEGMTAGGNATFLHTSVRLPDDEQLALSAPTIQAPMATREMTNAPDFLYNLFLTWDFTVTQTQVSLFYTVQGDTLVAGAGESASNFVPSVYQKQFDTLNLNVSQYLGCNTKLVFQAKNLTNPEYEEVYRSPYIGDDVLRSSYTKGIDISLGITGEWRF